VKKLVLTFVLLSTSSSFAQPVVTCKDPATGEAFYLSQNAGQPAHYRMNDKLVANLESQLTGREFLYQLQC
jgi:hypothetical protein